MIRQFIKGRVYVFIDAENVFYAQRTLGWKISYEKLMRYIKQECGNNTKCFLYKGVDEFNTKQQKFLAALENDGFLIERGKIVYDPEIREKGVDVKIAIDTGSKKRQGKMERQSRYGACI